MSQQIRISDILHSRLGNHAVNFETPTEVIGRILAYYEENDGKGIEIAKKKIKQSSGFSNSLEIVYCPSDEKVFKQKLVEKKQAFVQIFYIDGHVEEKEWNASRFKSSSVLKNNLYSGHLRGWKERGIWKIKVSIEKGGGKVGDCCPVLVPILEVTPDPRILDVQRRQLYHRCSSNKSFRYPPPR
jgi:hypothetical protein